MAVGLIAAGLFAAALLVTLMKLRGGKKFANNGFVLIPFETYTKELELEVKSSYWDEAFREDGHSREILLVKTGACDDGEEELQKARALAEKLYNVRVLRLGELESYFVKRRSGEGNERAGEDTRRGRSDSL